MSTANRFSYIDLDIPTEDQLNIKAHELEQKISAVNEQARIAMREVEIAKQAKIDELYSQGMRYPEMMQGRHLSKYDRHLDYIIELRDNAIARLLGKPHNEQLIFGYTGKV